MNTRSSEHDDNIEREPGGPPTRRTKITKQFRDGPRRDRCGMAATPAAANRPGPALGSSSRESVRARVRQEDRPRDEQKLQNNFGTSAVEAAEVWPRPRRRPTDRDQRSGRVSENPR